MGHRPFTERSFMGDDVIRIVRGAGTGPTAIASYDAALADAGVENYNLIPVSSIIPATVDVEVVGTAPDLGHAGNRLIVVQARATVEGTGRVTAALGWSTGEGPGVLYETGGEFDESEAKRRIRRGLEHARELREWTFDGEDIDVVSTSTGDAPFATAVVLAVYGDSAPIF